MKRVGSLWEKITDIENIKEAHRRARQDKTYYKEVKMVDADVQKYAEMIRDMLVNKTYEVSDYRIQEINDKGKMRKLMKLQYFPDRIIQLAVMLQLEPVFLNTFCHHTCASIPGRGIKRAWLLTNEYMTNTYETAYCLKMDIRKFYDSIDHETLKEMLRRKIKDGDLLWLLDLLIDSIPGDKGVPIGSYLSQYFANFYLSGFDHFLKEDLKIKRCVRYMDDVIVFRPKKQILHEDLDNIKHYLARIKLELKPNYQIFPVGVRGVDFVGFRFFPHFTLLRKKTAKRIKVLSQRVQAKGVTFHDFCAFNSYLGWMQMFDSYRFYTKYMEPLVLRILEYYFNEIPHRQGNKIKSYNHYKRNLLAKKGASVT